MKADERKKEILNCAKELFSSQGYYQTHISHIIEKAKIARGTVYQYFDNKDDIFVTLLEEFYANWRNAVSFDLTDTDGNGISGKAYFKHRIRQTLLFLAKDPDLCNIALRMGMGLPKKVAMLTNRFDKKVTSMIAEDLKIGQQFKTVRDTLNVDPTAAMLTGALLRTAQYYIINKRKKRGYSQKEIEKITDEFVNVFLHGIFMPRDKSNN
ncbi:MAG: TetR/AcrR family transcriptional regulator [Desulfobacteraceae bacterium]|jgi:AcrR family transcriptional regulator